MWDDHQHPDACLCLLDTSMGKAQSWVRFVFPCPDTQYHQRAHVRSCGQGQMNPKCRHCQCDEFVLGGVFLPFWIFFAWCYVFWENENEFHDYDVMHNHQSLHCCLMN